MDTEKAASGADQLEVVAMNKPLVQQFSDDLHDVVDKYKDSGITLAETIGAIEMVKLDVFEIHKESDDE